jgi:signal transduction histidine kinase
MVVQDYENEKAFGENEKQILIFVSEQIAQAIERKRSNEEIKRYAEELRQLNITKDKFFSIIAHYLRNPFITILGFSDILLTDYEELSDEERLFYIGEMKKSSEVSHNLLQNLLQWSRSQTGRIDYKPKSISLAQITSENLEIVELSAERKNITLSNSVPPDLKVSADEDMLNTILRNLITNAIKFTTKGGRIHVYAVEKNGFVETTVEDTGVGMDNETMDRIFRLDISHTKKGTDDESGTGLGLVLCKEFVKKHGGNIRIESEVGKGSKFIFSLPG